MLAEQLKEVQVSRLLIFVQNVISFLLVVCVEDGEQQIQKNKQADNEVEYEEQARNPVNLVGR